MSDPRCTCALYGTCETCQGIKQRRVDFETRRPPYVQDAVTVLEGLLRDAVQAEQLARNVADALGEISGGERAELGAKHPALFGALILLEDYANSRGVAHV